MNAPTTSMAPQNNARLSLKAPIAAPASTKPMALLMTKFSIPHPIPEMRRVEGNVSGTGLEAAGQGG